jgi:hypothetical protein
MVAAWIVTVAFAIGVGLIIAAASHNPHPEKEPTSRRRLHG